MSIGRDVSVTHGSRAERAPRGLVIGAGAVLMVVAAVIAAMIPATLPGWRFGVVAAAVLLFAVATLDHVALAVVALLGALIYDGFLEDRMGQLAWHGPDDLWRVLILVMVGAFGLAAGDAVRFVADHRTRTRTADSTPLSASPMKEERHGA